MKTKIWTIILLASVCMSSACPAPEFNHVIINQSDTVLDVEYEYVLPQTKYDSSELTAPLKMNLAEYEDKNSKAVCGALTAENEFLTESNAEVIVTNPFTGEQTDQKITKVKLLTNEILRVFISGHINTDVSGHINIDVKNLRRLSLRGKNGKLEIEGAGFEQFNAYRPDRFLPIRAITALFIAN